MPFSSLSNAFDRQSQPTQRAQGTPGPSRRDPFRPRLEGLEDRCLPSFGPALSFPTGTQPTAVAVGDFNGDGKLDLAVSDLGSTRPGGPLYGTLSVLTGNGDGTFGPAVSYPSVAHPRDVAVGDFNGDGKLDVVMANEGTAAGGTVSVFLGKGDGTFLPPISYAAGLEPSSVAVGDFNGDGKLDLVVANFDSNTVGVLLGNGNGTFGAVVRYLAGTNPTSVAVGDFNGDGKLDLAVADTGDIFRSDAGAGVSVLLGNGDGTFQPPQFYAAGAGPRFVIARDFNGDGKLDLAVVNQYSATVSVLLGNGNGTFQAARNFATGRSPTAVVAGDFDGDGKLDLAVANEAGPGVSVLFGNGDGTFQPAVSYFLGQSSPFSIAAGDFNGDGKLDLAVANAGSSTVSILLNGAVDNQQYVTKLYRDLLQRAPDPGGLAAFRTLVDQGVSRFQIVLAIENSLEYRTLVVHDLYGQLLDRPPDPSGLAAWVNFLSQGGTRQQLEAQIFGSNEYFARRGGGNTAGFLQAVYQDVLGRDPEPSGLAFWSRVLASGTNGEDSENGQAAGSERSAVATSILQSREAVRDEVQRLYSQFLRRAPDPLGGEAFTLALQQGLQEEFAITLLPGSDEYFSRP